MKGEDKIENSATYTVPVPGCTHGLYIRGHSEAENRMKTYENQLEELKHEVEGLKESKTTYENNFQNYADYHEQLHQDIKYQQEDINQLTDKVEKLEERNEAFLEEACKRSDVQAGYTMVKDHSDQIQVSYPKLELTCKPIENYVNKRIKKKAYAYMNDLIEGDLDTELSYTSSITVTYNQNQRISMKNDMYASSSDLAHPAKDTDGLTFDLKTGAEIKAEGLFKKGVDYRKEMEQVILNADIEHREDYIKDLLKSNSFPENPSFYLKENEVVFLDIVYTGNASPPIHFEANKEEINHLIK